MKLDNSVLTNNDTPKHNGDIILGTPAQKTLMQRVSTFNKASAATASNRLGATDLENNAPNDGYLLSYVKATPATGKGCNLAKKVNNIVQNAITTGENLA